MQRCSFLVPFLVLALLGSVASPALADDGNDREYIRILLKDPALSDETREALENLLEEEAEQEPSWAERLRVAGDFRLRHESTVERDDQRDRHRERLRFRFGATCSFGDEFLLGARLVTGDPDDANSTHVTIGDGLGALEVSLDRAYLRYAPTRVGGLEVSAGKFQHPFATNPIYGELVWDGDVQPEGVVARYQKKAESLAFELIAGEYVIVEQNDAADVAVSVFQGGLRHDAECCASRLAVGYYLYTNNTPDGDTTLLTDSQGNELVDTDGDLIVDEFRSDFGVVDVIASLAVEIAEQPVTFAGQYVKNTTTGRRSAGWALGASLGATKEPGDWSAYYQWQVMGQEAVFSPFAQDDFVFATNHRSHVFGAKYKCARSVDAHLWALVSQRDHPSAGLTTDSDKHQWRIRLDVNLKF